MVARRHKPAITAHARFTSPHVNHRLNCQHHANLELYAAMRATIIRHIGVFVHMTTNAMAHIIANNAISLRLGDALNGMANVTEMIASTRSREARPHAFLSSLEQHGNITRYFTDGIRPGIISNPAINCGARINRKNIAFAKNCLRRGNAMHDLIIHRGANGTRKAAIALEGRDSAFSTNERFSQFIELERRHAWLCRLAHFAEHIGGKPSRLFHHLNFCR